MFSTQDTDVGIMEDYLQRFRLFDAAVRLVTKSAAERGQELSEKLEQLLRDIASVIWRVVRIFLFCFLFRFFKFFFFSSSLYPLPFFIFVFFFLFSFSSSFLGTIV